MIDQVAAFVREVFPYIATWLVFSVLIKIHIELKFISLMLGRESAKKMARHIKDIINNKDSSQS